MGITISKKTYWTTLIYLFSALTNIALCFVLIPPLGISGAAMASALSASSRCFCALPWAKGITVQSLTTATWR